MIIYLRESPDWTTIRQMLSLSLLTLEPVTIQSGMTFIKSNPVYGPVLSDIAALAESAGAGRIIMEDEAIIYHPRMPVSWEMNCDSGKFSSISEMILFLAPALFMRDFRTVLKFSGVTHPSLFYPTNFVHETVFSFLERGGFYAGIVLKRYGFYGSGGGMVEARIYPRDENGAGNFLVQDRIGLKRARIVFSGPAMGFAEKIKGMIKFELGLMEDYISIIEVLDCDGMGISVLLYLDSYHGSFDSPVQCLVPHGADVYNSNGDLVFDEAESMEKLKEKIGYTKLCMTGNLVPEQVFRESALYLYLAGVKEIPGHYSREFGALVDDYGLFMMK